MSSHWKYVGGHRSLFYVSIIVKPCLICKESIVQDVCTFRNEISKPLAVTYSFILSGAAKFIYFVNSARTKLQTLRDPLKFP
jgi:hypothetical protein